MLGTSVVSIHCTSHTDLYLDFASHQPLTHKMAVVQNSACLCRQNLHQHHWQGCRKGAWLLGPSWSIATWRKLWIWPPPLPLPAGAEDTQSSGDTSVCQTPIGNWNQYIGPSRPWASAPASTPTRPTDKGLYTWRIELSPTARWEWSTTSLADPIPRCTLAKQFAP